MSAIWIVALVVIVVALIGWCAGVLVVSSRRRRATTRGDKPAPLPEDRDEINGGVFRGDPGSTNRPPGEP